MAHKALLIGNGVFSDSKIPALGSPVQDMDDLATLLRDPLVGPYDVTSCPDRDSREVRRAVQKFCDAAGFEDLLLVFISGHGIKDRQGALHFATRDTESDALHATALDARFLQERMDESAARQKILFLDTCYSGAFARGYYAKSGAAPAVTRDEFGSDSSSGKVVITASTGVQMAFENEVKGIRRSRFTRHLIEGIGEGLADRDGTGAITVDELYDHVCEGLAREGGEAAAQSPQRWYFGLQGSTVVARNPRPAALDPALLALLANPSARERAAGVDQLFALAKTGGGKGRLAEGRLRELMGDDSLMVSAAAESALRRLGKAEPERGSKPDPAPADAGTGTSPPEAREKRPPPPLRPEPLMDKPRRRTPGWVKVAGAIAAVFVALAILGAITDGVSSSDSGYSAYDPGLTDTSGFGTPGSDDLVSDVTRTEAAPVAQDGNSLYASAYAKWSSGDHAGAVADARRAAELGAPGAFGLLGEAYHTGKGVPGNLVEARGLFEKGVAEGDYFATLQLAHMLEMGEGGPPDTERALQLYTGIGNMAQADFATKQQAAARATAILGARMTQQMGAPGY